MWIFLLFTSLIHHHGLQNIKILTQSKEPNYRLILKVIEKSDEGLYNFVTYSNV